MGNIKQNILSRLYFFRSMILIVGTPLSCREYGFFEMERLKQIN